MGLVSFLQRQETNRLLRQQRNNASETNSFVRNIDNFLSEKMQRASKPQTVAIRIKTPNKTFTVKDASDRPIVVTVPVKYETVTAQGETVEMVKDITIELEITHGNA